MPERSATKGSAHAYLSAPYGIYETKNGFLALAMGNLSLISSVIQCDISDIYSVANDAFNQRDEIILRLNSTFRTANSHYWIELLESHGIWCAEVLDYQKAINSGVYQDLGIEQEVRLANGSSLKTTTSPIRLDHQKLYAPKAAPKLGENNEKINQEFELN